MKNNLKNSNDKSVSVVVPFYNRSRFLKRLLDSIEIQTMEIKKIYIIDNGSSLEETLLAWDILSSHILSSKCLFTSSLGKGNANYARNLGYELAKTKYVAFLDSDDWWNENHLSDSIECLESSKKVAVYSGPIIHISESISYSGQTTDVNNFDNPFSLILGGFMAQTSSYLVNKDELKYNIIWDEKLKRHQDYDYFAQVFYKTQGWCYCSKYNSNIDWNYGGTNLKNFDFDSCIYFYERWESKIPNDIKKRYLKEMLYLAIKCNANKRIISFYKSRIINNKYFKDRIFWVQCSKPYVNLKVFIKDPAYSKFVSILNCLGLKEPIKNALKSSLKK